MPTRVLVVDDSALMRRLLTGVLTEAGYQVETAHTGKQGVEKLVQWQPDVVTLDINMPEMDGLTALSLMMAARPTPVIMVSSLTAEGALATLEALALGAVDFITKPGGTISLSIDDIRQQLLDKVRAAGRAKPREATKPALTQRTAARAPVAPKPVQKTQAKVDCPGMVLVGVSTGGPRTLEDILPHLPADFPLPVLVCQHMPANFTDAFAHRMDRLCPLHVREVNTTLPIEPGNIYIGKGGTDMVVAERLNRLVAMPKSETPGHPWHPSVDVMVESAMKHVPAERLFGVQLTGMGNDGAEAMTQLKRQGGRTIAEHESTAVVFGMPQELINAGGATLVLPSHNIARQLKGWLL
jgi:two-component system chemotaxis response regulator CheB